LNIGRGGKKGKGGNESQTLVTNWDLLWRAGRFDFVQPEKKNQTFKKRPLLVTEKEGSKIGRKKKVRKESKSILKRAF